MEGIVLTFVSELFGSSAQRQIWIDVVKKEVPAGRLAKDPQGNILDSIEGLTDDQIFALKICGNLEGHFVLDNGTTTSYGELYKAYDLAKWYMEKPPAEFLVNVTDYSEETFDPAWIPPDYRESE